MKVKRTTLFLLAALVWSTAGINIFLIGIKAYSSYLSVLNLSLSALIFFTFQIFIFGKLVKKHSLRILSYSEEQVFFFKFFDLKGFIMMAIMMSGGVFLRSSKLASEQFIAVFYSGLGASLLLAGLLFVCNFRKTFCQLPQSTFKHQ